MLELFKVLKTYREYKINFERGVCLCQRMVIKNLSSPMSSKVFRLLRAVSSETFLFFLIVGTSPHLFLHKPWLTESSGADHSIIRPWGSAFYSLYSYYYLAPALGKIKMSTDSILIRVKEAEELCLT